MGARQRSGAGVVQRNTCPKGVFGESVSCLPVPGLLFKRLKLVRSFGALEKERERKRKKEKGKRKKEKERERKRINKEKKETNKKSKTREKREIYEIRKCIFFEWGVWHIFGSDCSSLQFAAREGQTLR